MIFRSTIAGTGVNLAPSNGSTAATNPIRTSGSGRTWGYFANDASGNVYFARGSGYISQLNRGTGNWTDLVGGGANNYYDVAADGTASIILPGGYHPLILGMDDTNILSSKSWWSGGHQDAFLKLYNMATGVQSHLAGVAGGAGLTYCSPANNTVALTACSVTSAAYATTYHTRASYDSFSSRWIIGEKARSTVYVLTVGGNLDTLVTLPRTIRSFAYKHDAGNNIIYYCGNDDGLLYKYDIASPGETALAWPISSIACSGQAMLYNATRNSLVFPYTQNGLHGIAEYENP